jgi:deazaflavin-dependent oxidoreductase (nitroreductase family)
MEGRTLMLLTTVGGKSREPRTVVLGFGRDGDRYVVIASNNGATRHPAWYHNLMINPEVTVEVPGAKVKARARTATSQERERFKPLVPYIRQQQQLTEREIPIVVLEPTG